MIKLSKLADYGIVIITHLAQGSRHSSQAGATPGRSATDRSASAVEVAKATGIPQPMTSKILKALMRAELVRSVRGARGGYTLAKPASTMTVVDVVEALEGPIALTTCVEHGNHACSIESQCPTRATWQKINMAVRAALSELTIEAMATPGPLAAHLGQHGVASSREARA